MNNKTFVSVVVLTYNHEQYIRKALDSILMQEINFKYEIVLGDDCSTDETRTILRAYEKDYPGIFKIIYREKNIGTTKNLYDVFMHCEGKYIAQLEGDDFWIDSYKLQNQVEFLETNDKYIGVAHSCNVLCSNMALGKGIEAFYHCKDGSVFGFAEYKRKRFPGHTCTLVYRNIFLDFTYDYSIIYNADYYIGDRTVNMLLTAQGYIYCMDRPMSVYRAVIKEGESNVNSLYKGKNRLIDDWNYEERLDNYCRKTFLKTFLTNDSLAKQWTQALVFYIKSSIPENQRILKEFTTKVKLNPGAVLYIPKHLIKKFLNVLFWIRG